MSTHNTLPVIPPVARTMPKWGWENWLATLANAINLLLNGKMNAVAAVTLTASATSTTLVDSRIGLFSHVTIEPATASAAAARAGLYIVSSDGQAVITHASDAAIDQIFSVLIIG